MKTLNQFLLIMCGSIMLTPLTARAIGPLLSVDFNSDSNVTETDSPVFQSFLISNNAPVPALMQTFGPTTIKLAVIGAGNLSSRDRNNSFDACSPRFTFGDLYRDFATTLDNQTLEITISGLTAAVTYTFTFYAYDQFAFTDTFTNTTGGTQPSPTTGMIACNGTPPTANDDYVLILDAIADGTGTVTFSVQAETGNSPRLNGLVISAGPQGLTGLMLLGADSVKNHGGNPAGPNYAIDMPLAATIANCNSGVECRRGGDSCGGVSGDYTVAFHFNHPVAGLSLTASATPGGTGSVNGWTFSGNDMIIALSNVSDVQVLTIKATAGSYASQDVAIGFLLGDTSGNRGVNSTDVAQTRAAAGPVTAANFREDVIVSNGMITATDVSQVKFRVGFALPCP